MSLRPALFLLLFTPALSGCGGGAIKLCGEIPPDGCPIGRGGTCGDAVCAALYDCVDGEWTPVERCSGGPGDGGLGPDGGPGDAGVDAACMPVKIDHTGETSGCAPDLQSPDCPAVAAETCAAVACVTGCVDFFLCAKDGWKEVAYCDDQGDLVLVAP